MLLLHYSDVTKPARAAKCKFNKLNLYNIRKSRGIRKQSLFIVNALVNSQTHVKTVVFQWFFTESGHFVYVSVSFVFLLVYTHGWGRPQRYAVVARRLGLVWTQAVQNCGLWIHRADSLRNFHTVRRLQVQHSASVFYRAFKSLEDIYIYTRFRKVCSYSRSYLHNIWLWPSRRTNIAEKSRLCFFFLG